MSGICVVKVGGSLCAEPVRLAGLLASLSEGAFGAGLIVPGGGAFADAVRAAQAREGFDDAEAHRRALDAMGRMAARFRDIEPRLTIRTTLPSRRAIPTPRRVGRDGPVPAAPDAGGPAAVWDPVALRAGHPRIPETWDVTSDSLALWAATEIAAPRCILVKSVDAPRGADARDLARLGLVDAAFPRFAQSYRGGIAILGPGGETPVALRAAA